MNYYKVISRHRDGEIYRIVTFSARHETEAIDIGVGDEVSAAFVATRSKICGVECVTVRDKSKTDDYWEIFCLAKNI